MCTCLWLGCGNWACKLIFFNNSLVCVWYVDLLMILDKVEAEIKTESHCHLEL